MLDMLRRNGLDSSIDQRHAGKPASGRKRRLGDARGLKLASDDVREIKRKVGELYEGIAARYYLEPDVEPDVRVQGNAIRITIPVEKLR